MGICLTKSVNVSLYDKAGKYQTKYHFNLNDEIEMNNFFESLVYHLKTKFPDYVSKAEIYPRGYNINPNFNDNQIFIKMQVNNISNGMMIDLTGLKSVIYADILDYLRMKNTTIEV